MNKKVLEVNNKHQEGAKLNLTIDIAPEDCFLMCKELFNNLKDHEQKELIGDYLKERVGEEIPNQNDDVEGE